MIDTIFEKKLIVKAINLKNSELNRIQKQINDLEYEKNKLINEIKKNIDKMNELAESIVDSQHLAEYEL